MSEIVGRLAVQARPRFLEQPRGGRGVLLGGGAGVAAGDVTIIRGGIVGTNAAVVAIGMQADVTVLDRDLGRLRDLEMLLDGRVRLIYAMHLAIAEQVARADLVIGAVLRPGACAPHVVTREMIRAMTPGSVVVDVAVDQGGCIETTRPTTHADPVYTVAGVVHYCVANMPAAVPVSATPALCNATLPHVVLLADHGLVGALREDPGLRHGVNIRDGKLVNAAVDEALQTS
jgi:alanine dehydrogenase